MGLRYLSVLPLGDMSSLPGPAQAAINSCIGGFVRRDRGAVRAANDQTFDTRAIHFANWLRRLGIDNLRLQTITPEQGLALICAYATSVTEGDVARPSSVRDGGVAESTIVGYIRSAHTWMTTMTNIIPPTWQVKDGKQKLHPFLGDIIAERRNWREPQKKKEPFTFPMFDVLHRRVTQLVAMNPTAALDCDAAILDWTKLGVHTGSRLAEYGQSKKPKGAQFATVPRTAAAGRWAGQALAFILDDFEFYDGNRCKMTTVQLLLHPDRAMEIHVRFRYDKAGPNFSIRKYRRVPGCYMCPVLTGTSIITRAVRLGVPSGYPIGVFRNPVTGTFQFIEGKHVQDTMRAACVLAYPDPAHYMRLHLDRLVTHSNRVTAAVALENAGASVEDIAFRLRWSVASVKFYLRDCFRTIGAMTLSAIAGAMMS